MRKEARTLYGKAVDSLVLGVDHFNRAWDRGRTEAVLIMLDRAFELLLKAVIVHRGGKIREKKGTQTIGFDSCLRKCFSEEPLICLSEDDVVALQNLNSLRDAAQHYLVEVSEHQLYIYAQAAVSLFGRLTKDVLGLPLRDDVPERVLPVCAKPPKDIGAVLDMEFADIKAMVSPGSRRRLDAKAKLRAFAVLQASLDGRKSQPSDAELDAVVKRIHKGEEWRAIFPGVATLTIDPEADGPGLALRVTKKEGEAVRLVTEGTPDATVIAVKRVNELDYYSLGLKDLTKKLKTTQPKLLLLMEIEGIQENLDYCKTFKIGKMETKRYSANALDFLYKKLREIDIEEFWQEHRKGAKVLA
ncbi:DUF3644 domain-containing protein [Azospirillum ramasamyi]|uniref:DUF3644 domain-containing protein n=1 Tax=Azospirillum ramasamyi TaxID=682998 RepID=A0A2U9SEN6_9PROT|nr:DUF3644 domain-containing protein [Azospirillum ramasamyi]AWU98075.1 hypothetical protein DM194_27695 [Azospirillum ramasamyi]